MFVKSTLWLLTFSDLIMISFQESFVFNRELTGVSFTPYVKSHETYDSFSCLDKYTFDELKTMLLIISSKFGRVVTSPVEVFNDEYTSNSTYYDSSCIIARTAEAAAIINKENGQKILSVIIGIHRHEDKVNGESKTQAEMDLALEASQIANEIYPGTVSGFQISNVLSDTKSAISGSYWIDFLRNSTSGTDLKVGITASFSDIHKLNLREDAILAFKKTPDENKEPRMKLILKSDFVICKLFGNISQSITNPQEQLFYFRTYFLIYKSLFESINPKIITMGYTGWASEGHFDFQNVKNLKEYWITMNNFSMLHNFTLWFHEAFDNPWKINSDDDLPHYGWWTLDDNENAGNISAYVEKASKIGNSTDVPGRSENLAETKYSASTGNVYVWIGSGVGVVCGVLLIMILLGSLLNLYKKKVSLQKFVLSKREIKEFKHGAFDTAVKIAEHGNDVCGIAMQIPYDKTLEIPKKKIEIYWDQVLGAGMFGSVCKAMLKMDKPKEVALKTTKVGCPKSALRGLLSEIKILTHLGQHVNIVSICGAYTAELTKGRVYVALELCSNGSLKSRLLQLNRRQSATSVGARTAQDEIDNSDLQINLLRWSYEIASGMEHISKKGVVHADLATRNVLLTSEGVAKIADFGLSRRLYEYTQYVKKQEEPLPFRWMAVESLKLMQFSSQSDVWSFGVTIWEIFSLGAEPYAGYSYDASFIESLENKSAKLLRPSTCSSEMFKIMQDCWHLQPDKRPTFSYLRPTILEICNKSIYLDLSEAG